MLQPKRLTKKEKRIQRQNKRKNVAQQNQEIKLNFSLRSIDPLTKNQKLFFDFYDDGHELIMLKGSAGTGKSFIAMYKALEELLEPDTQYKKLIIIRSAVQSREIGHLPGTAKEKAKLFEMPYIQICEDLFDAKDPYSLLSNKGIIEFITTSFIRGITFDDSIIIVDEIQNMTFQELLAIMTRVGNNSRIIFCGDFKQNDLYRYLRDQSGLPKFVKIVSKMKSAKIVEFTTNDVVRSGIVREFLLAVEQVNDDEYFEQNIQTLPSAYTRTEVRNYA